MPGLFPHLIVGLISAVIVLYYFKDRTFAYMIFGGNLLPDALKFGIPAIQQKTLAFWTISHDSMFKSLSKITGSFQNWFSMGFFVLAIAFYLYEHHIIKKKTMKEYDEGLIFLLVGVATHLIMDLLIFEKTWYWL